MAAWDSADLLSRVQFHANRPSVDESMTNANWYTLLSDAQQKWVRVIAALAPESQMGDPVLLTEATTGKIWTFPAWPMGHLELRDGRDGPLLTVGADYLDSTDFVWEGDQVRVPSNQTRSFPDGVYARYVAVPDVISAAVEPTLRPAPARMLLVYEACAEWAGRGGHRDPGPYLTKLQRLWYGDPALPGDTGLLGMFRTQVLGQGIDAAAGGAGRWYRTADFF